MQKQVTNDRVHPQGSHRADSESVEAQFVEEHVNVQSVRQQPEQKERASLHSDDEMPEVPGEIASRQDPATVEVDKTRASRSSRSQSRSLRVIERTVPRLRGGKTHDGAHYGKP